MTGKLIPTLLLEGDINSKRLKEIGEDGVLAMICDSTNVFSVGKIWFRRRCKKKLNKYYEQVKKKIIVTSFASNVARMETIFHCAKQTGRNISLVGRSMHRIFKAARKCGYLKDVIEPIDPREAKNLPREKIVYLMYR